jgi:GNAT superfamily N-acetyltransferase
VEWKKGDYILTDEADRIDLDAVMALLSESYWAPRRPRAKMAKAVEHSVCFSLFLGSRQIGFIRVVTDRATFAWICDVMIHPDYRGVGLGTWMMQCVLEHPHTSDMHQVLRTRDAHEFYAQFGFSRGDFLWRSWQD